MMNIKWYVLYVNTGQEHAVAEQLRHRGFDAVVPIESKLIRSKGEWTTQQHILLTAMFSFVWITSGQNFMCLRAFRTLLDCSEVAQALSLLRTQNQSLF